MIRTRSRRAGLKIFRGVVVTTYSRPVCDTFGTSWPQDMSRIIKYSRPICAAIRTRSRRAGLKIDILKISRIIKYSGHVCATIRTRSRQAGLKTDIPQYQSRRGGLSRQEDGLRAIEGAAIPRPFRADEWIDLKTTRRTRTVLLIFFLQIPEWRWPSRRP